MVRDNEQYRAVILQENDRNVALGKQHRCNHETACQNPNMHLLSRPLWTRNNTSVLIQFAALPCP